MSKKNHKIFLITLMGIFFFPINSFAEIQLDVFKIKICATRGTVVIPYKDGKYRKCTLAQNGKSTDCIEYRVKDGISINTGQYGFALVNLKGTIVKLRPESKLDISRGKIKLEYGGAHFLFLPGSGYTRTLTGEIHPNYPHYRWVREEDYESGAWIVECIEAIQHIQGTEFTVEVIENNTAKIHMIEGILEVSNITKQKTVRLTAEMEVIVAPGSPPSAPKSLQIAENKKWWTNWPTLVPISEMPSDDDPLGSGTTKGINSTEAIADAYVYAYNYRNWNKSNRGAYDQLRAGWHPTGGESRAYLKFDLSKVDPVKANKAVLRLYQFSVAGNTGVNLGVYNVTTPWLEGSDTYHSGRVEKTAAPGELSWVQQPAIDNQAVATFNPGNIRQDYVEVDITSLVKKWLTGSPNHGLVIKAEGHLSRNTGESVYHFASRELDVNLDSPKGKSKKPTLLLSDNNQQIVTNVNIKNVGKLKWTFNIGDNLYSGSEPAIASDGTIYISANGDQISWKSARICAVKPDGTLKWKSKELDSINCGGLGIGADDTIYAIGSYTIYAINPADGSFIWTWEVPHEGNNHYAIAYLAIGNDETLFVSHVGYGAYHRKIIAVTPQGQTKWIAEHKAYYATHLTVGKNGTLFAYRSRSSKGYLFAINPDSGAEIWATELPGVSEVRGIAIRNDGNVIISYSAKPAKLINIDASSGNILWSKNDVPPGHPSIAPNGDILLFAFNDGLCCYNSSGKFRWHVKNLVSGIHGIAIDSDGKIYVSGSDHNNKKKGNFQSFNSDGKLTWAISLPHDGSPSPAISADGTIYIIGSGDKLFAVQGDKPLASSGWPRANYKNSNSRDASGGKGSTKRSSDNPFGSGNHISDGFSQATNGTSTNWNATRDQVLVMPVIIAKNNSRPWVIGTDNGIHYGTKSGWVQQPGGGLGKDIAIDGSGRPWVIGSDNGIYYHDGNRWIQYPGGGKGFAVDVSSDGTPWVIGTDQGIYYHDGNRWVQYPGGGKGFDIDVSSDGTPWVIGTDNGIYYHDSNRWVPYPGGGRGSRIAISPNGTPWVIGSDNRIYYGTGSGWVQKPGEMLAKDITIDESGRPWVISRDNSIYYHDRSRWIEYPGSGRGLAIAISKNK